MRPSTIAATRERMINIKALVDILVQSRRDKKAAKKFFRKLFKKIAVCAASDHYRQAEKLQCGEN
jgi:hypothetical protein